MKVARKEGRYQRTKSSPRSRRWLWLTLFAVILVGGAGLAIRGLTAGSPATLTADHTFHDFGQASMQNGLLVARLPLTVQGPTTVVDVQTS